MWSQNTEGHDECILLHLHIFIIIINRISLHVFYKSNKRLQIWLECLYYYNNTDTRLNLHL